MREKTLAAFLLIAYGLMSGIIFKASFGRIEISDYLIEVLSIGFLEVPFIVFFAFLSKKYGALKSFTAVISGTVVFFLAGHGDAEAKPMNEGVLDGFSITPLIFIKDAVSGIITGFLGNKIGFFREKLILVLIPSVIFAFLCGGILISGPAPYLKLEELKTESLEVYRVFMNEDSAKNAAENAGYVFEGIFKAGLAFIFVFQLLIVWVAFNVTDFLFKKIDQESLSIPPFNHFRMPFSFIWLFLAGFGFLLIEYAPVAPVAINVFITMLVLYFTQGLAVVLYYMNRKELGSFPRIIFWLTFFVTFGIVGSLIAILGIIDSWFNFRLRISNK